MEFIVKIGIKKEKKDSIYKDKNQIVLVITPDMPEYLIVMNGKEIETKVTANPAVKQQWEKPESTKKEEKKPTTNDPKPTKNTVPPPSDEDCPVWAR